MARNVLNGRLYFGITERSLRRRVSDHVSCAKNSPYRFHRALRKYGRDGFEWIEVAHVPSRSEAVLVEHALIATFRTMDVDCGYNSTLGGEGVTGPRLYRKCMKGRKLTDEHRQKLREAWKTRPPMTDETRAKLSASHKGKPMNFSEEALKKIANAGRKNRGRRIAGTGRPKGPSPLLGRPRSPETREKIGAALRGKAKSKPSSLRGRPRPPEVREKIRASHLARREQRRANLHL